MEKKLIKDADRSKNESIADAIMLKEFVNIPKVIFKQNKKKLAAIEINAAVFLLFL